MSSLEFAYWREQYQREPFGYDIENFRTGSIAAAVVNVTPHPQVRHGDACGFLPKQTETQTRTNHATARAVGAKKEWQAQEQ